VPPDVVLVNEFDFDDDGAAANLFRTNYLSVAQRGADPIDYPYVFTAPGQDVYVQARLGSPCTGVVSVGASLVTSTLPPDTTTPMRSPSAGE
jgi:hypothetical protein